MSENSPSSKPETPDLNEALTQLFDRMLDEMVAAGVGITATLGAIRATKLDDKIDAPDDPS
jgi:peptide deformylase